MKLPEGWKEEKLGNLVKVIMGQAPPSKSYNKNKDGIPFVKVSEFGDTFPKETVWTNDPKKKANRGDVLVCVVGSIGKVNKGIDCAIGRSVASIRPIKKEILQDFLYYFLILKTNQISSLGQGTTQGVITQEHIKSLSIILPSFDIQQKIVSTIETHFSRLDNAIKNLKSTKNKIQLYRKAILKRAFEKKKWWKEKSINEVFITNPQKSELNKLPDDLDVSFVPMKFVSENLKKIINSEKRKLSNVKKGYTYFKNNDIIFAKITPCFENGKMAFVEDMVNGIGFGSTEFHVFRKKGGVLSKLLFYFLQNDKFRGDAKRNMTGTAGQLRVPIKFIENYKISYPTSIAEQESIIQNIESKLSVIDKVEEAVDKSLVKAEKLRKSILKNAFEGKLVKQGRNN